MKLEQEFSNADLQPSTARLSALEGNSLKLSIETNLKSEDSVRDKLFREAQVLLGGAIIGAAQTTGNRLTENFGNTMLQTAASAGLGYAFVRLASSNFTPVRYAMPVLAGAMTYSFAANLAGDLKNQASTISTAWTKAWNDPGSVNEQQKRVAESVGPFVFDMTLNTLAGIAGGKIAANGIENRAIKSFMEEKYGQQIRESVFTIASEADKSNLRYVGSSFAVDRNKLATAFHVVQDKPGDKWHYFNSSSKGEAKILAGLPQGDLAILQTAESNAVSFSHSFPIAKNLEKLPSAGVLVGSVGGKRIELRPGVFEEGLGVTGNNYTADLGPEIAGGFTRVIRGGKSWPGMSGGPAIAETGEVVGVMSSLNPFLNVVGMGTSSVPATNISYLMRLIERAKQPGIALNLTEASQSFGMSQTKVIEQVQRGKLQGFVIPSESKPLQWEWRILKPEQAKGK